MWVRDYWQGSLINVASFVSCCFFAPFQTMLPSSGEKCESCNLVSQLSTIFSPWNNKRRFPPPSMRENVSNIYQYAQNYFVTQNLQCQYNAIHRIWLYIYTARFLCTLAYDCLNELNYVSKSTFRWIKGMQCLYRWGTYMIGKRPNSKKSSSSLMKCVCVGGGLHMEALLAIHGNFYSFPKNIYWNLTKTAF